MLLPVIARNYSRFFEHYPFNNVVLNAKLWVLITTKKQTEDNISSFKHCILYNSTKKIEEVELNTGVYVCHTSRYFTHY